VRARILSTGPHSSRPATGNNQTFAPFLQTPEAPPFAKVRVNVCGANPSYAGNLPWVHMDIAGTAWAEEAKPYQPKGATGVGVRTLAELALDVDSWGSVK
jgi:hypothetical protein